MKRPNLFKLLLILAVIVVGFIVYRAVFVTDEPGLGEPGLDVVGLESEDENSDEFLNILLSLQQIELSDEVFSDPVFISLVDFSTELQDQTPGRQNPFAPIGVGGRPINSGDTGTSTDDF